MAQYEDIRPEVRRYLLGGLYEEAGRGVEERLMTDENFLEELTLAEGELIDDYVAGRLSVEERAEFEGHFLSNEGRRRQLSFTQALSRYATEHAPAAESVKEESVREESVREEPAGRYAPGPRAGERPGFGERLRAFWSGLARGQRAGLAVAAVAVVVLALWLAIPSAPRAPETFIALSLAPGAGQRAPTGGPRPGFVKLPLGADALKLTLTLPEGAPPAARYRAELSREATGVMTLEAAAHDARTATFVIPESSLARGRHTLTLSAAGADGADAVRVGSYFFDVE